MWRPSLCLWLWLIVPAGPHFSCLVSGDSDAPKAGSVHCLLFSGLSCALNYMLAWDRECPLVWKHTVVLPASRPFAGFELCSQSQSGRAVLGAAGNKRPVFLPLDSNASWVSIEMGRKKVILLALVYIRLWFFQFKKYIINWGIWDMWRSKMFEPWRQRPGFEYFPNFVRPWAKHLTFQFPYQ